MEVGLKWTGAACLAIGLTHEALGTTTLFFYFAATHLYFAVIVLGLKGIGECLYRKSV